MYTTLKNFDLNVLTNMAHGTISQNRRAMRVSETQRKKRYRHKKIRRAYEQHQIPILFGSGWVFFYTTGMDDFYQSNLPRVLLVCHNQGKILSTVFSFFGDSTNCGCRISASATCVLPGGFISRIPAWVKSWGYLEQRYWVWRFVLNILCGRLASIR
jgi:hypothetical protein